MGDQCCLSCPVLCDSPTTVRASVAGKRIQQARKGAECYQCSPPSAPLLCKIYSVDTIVFCVRAISMAHRTMYLPSSAYSTRRRGFRSQPDLPSSPHPPSSKSNRLKCRPPSQLRRSDQISPASQRQQAFHQRSFPAKAAFLALRSAVGCGRVLHNWAGNRQGYGG